MSNNKEKPVVIFLETNMVKKLSEENKKELLGKISSLGYKVYTTENVEDLTKLKKPTIHRFGFIPDRIATKVRVKGGQVIPGDF